MLSIIDDGKNVFPVVCKKDVQLFLKRLRKKWYGSKSGDLRYFIVSEYGPTTYRPHYHGILFNVPNCDLVTTLEKVWNMGFVSVSPVTDERVSYCAKYCCCTALLPDYLTQYAFKHELICGHVYHRKFYPYKPFMMCSKGIGKSLLELDTTYNYYQSHYTYIRKGVHYAMPRYYKDKLYLTDEKKQEVKDYLNGQREASENRMLEELQGEVESFGSIDAWRKVKNEILNEKLKRNLIKKSKL